MNTRSRIIFAATVAGAAGLLAGCVSSSGPAAPRPTVTVTATTTVTTPASNPASTPTPVTPPAGPAGCTTAGLRVVLGAPTGAAGSAYYPIRFTNTSDSDCSLYGYPGVSFVSSRGGAQIGAAALRNPVFPRRLVIVRPGGTAHAELQVANARNYPASACHPVAGHWLRVYPPGQVSPLYISITSTACSAASVHVLSVQTVQPGPGE